MRVCSSPQAPSPSRLQALLSHLSAEFGGYYHMFAEVNGKVTTGILFSCPITIQLFILKHHQVHLKDSLIANLREETRRYVIIYHTQVLCCGSLLMMSSLLRVLKRRASAAGADQRA